MSDSAIEIGRANKWYGSNHAVRDLSLVVPEGSICGFLGPNGAGKSTTIRMVMSIILPDTGTIRVLGADALKNKDRIGYLPEERGIYQKMRVGAFLEYIAALKGVEKPQAQARTKQWLARMELPDVYRSRCQELSKGMQQKVQFIASVIHEPALLILDEPFSGLDPVNTQLLSRVIDELREGGTTIIYSTHVLQQAETICDRFFLINKGVKLLDATLEEIHRRFDPRTVRVEPLNGEVDFTRFPGVRHVRSTDRSGALELEIDDGADPQQIMRGIVNECPVRSIELNRLTLSEVFIHLVRMAAGRDAADAAREELSDE